MTTTTNNNNTKPNIPTLEENHFLLFNKEFNPSSTGDAIRFIIERNLMIKDTPKNIKMIINSEGGEVPSAFALIDTMKGSKIPIHTYGLGQIASCGLLTFIAGEYGHRYITPNTSILSHQFFWGYIGKEHELMVGMKEVNNMSIRIIEHYKKCTGLTEKAIKTYLLPPEDVWLTAKEAVKLGLADKIVNFY
jgi:ATP-dependent Clp protease protease subunit